MTDIPERHGIHINQARKIVSPILFGIRNKVQAEPDAATWQRLGERLLQGDSLADNLVEWLQTDTNASWKTFEQALKDAAVDKVYDCDSRGGLSAEPLQAFITQCQSLPSWVDTQALDRAAFAIGRSGKAGMRVLRDFGLMAGYQASAINQTLVQTGALSKGAARRVAETTKWWIDCTEPGNMLPGGAGWKSTLRVRVIHAMVRQRLNQREGWDSDYLGLPVNQVDMQVTYLAFSVMFLLGLKLIGMPYSRRESEDIMHLWRYIGWLMGVDESLLAKSEQEGRVMLYQNLLSQAQADSTSVELAKALKDEPLSRHYKGFTWLHRHWDRQVHLSLVRYFIGRRGMKALGLSPWTVPWYPLLTAVPRFFFHALIGVLPGGKACLNAYGRQNQQKQLRVMFGPERPEILEVSHQ